MSSLADWCKSATMLILGDCCFRDLPTSARIFVSKNTFGYPTRDGIRQLLYSTYNSEITYDGAYRRVTRVVDRWTGQIAETVDDNGLAAKLVNFQPSGFFVDTVRTYNYFYQEHRDLRYPDHPSTFSTASLSSSYSISELIPYTELDTLSFTDHQEFFKSGYTVSKSWRSTATGLVFDLLSESLIGANGRPMTLHAEVRLTNTGTPILSTTPPAVVEMESLISKTVAKHQSRACLVDRNGSVASPPDPDAICIFRYSDRTANQNLAGVIINPTRRPLTTEAPGIYYNTLYYQDGYGYSVGLHGLINSCCTTAAPP